MKMKIPTEETSNVYESSNEFSPDNSEGGHPEGNNSPSADGDFSEYLWMENEEEFDKQILQQLEEEALMEHCIEVMLDHERDLDSIPYLSSLGSDDAPPPSSWSGQYQNGSDLCYQMSSLRVQDKDELAKQSTLNPDAAEFVPGAKPPSAPIAEKSS